MFLCSYTWLGNAGQIRRDRRKRNLVESCKIAWKRSGNRRLIRVQRFYAKCPLVFQDQKVDRSDQSNTAIVAATAVLRSSSATIVSFTYASVSSSLCAVGHVCGSRAAVAEEASVGGSGEASSNSGAVIPSVASTTSGTSDSKRLAVNAPGNRSDPGWKHGIAVDENPKKVQCKYCQKVINGGIYRLKHHLAGTQKDVGACKAVSDDVRKEMWKIVSSLQENLIKRAKEIEGRSSDSSPLGQYEDEEVEGAKRQRREIAKNPADLFKKRGVSSQTTINGIFKKNLREEACQGIASFFYNNAIPSHVAKSDEFKKMLDLVARHEKDLIRPATTRFATSYLTLGCLNDNKGALIRMFTSKEWKSSQFAKTKDGKVIENVVMDKDFWKSIITCLRSAYPLIKVLRLVDSYEKPAMGFIYEEMDRAKEKIQAAFNGHGQSVTSSSLRCKQQTVPSPFEMHVAPLLASLRRGNVVVEALLQDAIDSGTSNKSFLLILLLHSVLSSSRYSVYSYWC
ncbi:hypothetical protein ZIOFF_027977 [Zingiber officinale]|uniref:BED-type domain-containing protein n=1 Tax=Zingiber officinale TaxID=94328 RepID=A0A8J5L8P7_ZINOF|nr:hypothetical protein ZIOFF_027977 [Zingiber officinale]